MLMFKSIHGLVPNYLCDEITMQRDIAERTTRSTINSNVHVPHITLECCKNAFAYRGPVLWNARIADWFLKMSQTTRSRKIDAMFMLYGLYIIVFIIIVIM